MSKFITQLLPASDRKAWLDVLNYLHSIDSGPINDTSVLTTLLAACWDQIDGSDVEGMDAYKLHGRMENVSWDPPELSFTIERHGQTVCGSSRASLFEICVNTKNKTAFTAKKGYRQSRPMNKGLDVKPIAREIAKLIMDSQHDDRLKWSSNDKVTVLIGKIIPAVSAPSQTVTGRRKRLRQAVDELLTTSGWQIVRANVYTRIDQPE